MKCARKEKGEENASLSPAPCELPKRLDVGLGKSVDEVALDDERAQSASGGDRVSQRLPERLEIGESVQARTNPKLGQRRPATVATSLPKTAEKRAGCVPKL